MTQIEKAPQALIDELKPKIRARQQLKRITRPKIAKKMEVSRDRVAFLGKHPERAVTDDDRLIVALELDRQREHALSQSPTVDDLAVRYGWGKRSIERLDDEIRQEMDDD